MKKTKAILASIFGGGGILIIGILGWLYDYGSKNPIYLSLNFYNNLSILGFGCLVLGFIFFFVWLFHGLEEGECIFPV